MLPEDLKQKLLEVNSSKTKRLEVASWVTKKPHYVREILQWNLKEESDLLIQSAYVLEIICERKAELFFKYMHLFFEGLPNIENDSALRACAKICEMLCRYHFRQEFDIFSDLLNEAERKCITECSFDWLISDQKVACQVPAMQCLYYLGYDEDSQWIHPELKIILTQNAPIKSAGYKARARKILKNLD
tara:strand:+ start:126 stop:692 length:567 start_codon:yes stop_codon:yes gene_type:complete